MGTTRFRQRNLRMDHVLPDGSNWNQSIFLGHFRDKVTGIENGVPFEYWGNPYSPQSYVPDRSTMFYERTWDENHGRPRGRSSNQELITRSFYNTGGPLLNIKIDTGLPKTGVIPSQTLYSVNGSRMYEGGFMSPPNNYWGGGWAESPGNYTTNSNALLPDVAPYFDRAWKKAKPKLETASLYVALRESKDLSRMLQTTAKLNALEYSKHAGAQISFHNMRPKGVAEQFLNHQFGWVPFLKDLGQFYQTWVDASDTIKRITMENGKWRRKSVRVEKAADTQIISETQLPVSSTSYAIPCFPTSFPAEFFLSPPSWRIVEETTLTINASGKFRFYRPEFDITLPDYTSAWNQVMRYVKIYGLSVSPYHIWQATPWTWLIDWVSNLGSFIERLNDIVEDHVAAAYFYITSRKTVVRRMEIHLPFVTGHQTLSFERSYRSKQRVSADSPYGFSLSWDDLSPRRLAILGALGITRKA